MSTRRPHKLPHRLIWLLVALLSLRGLVPAGYMVDVDRGGLSLVVCGSGIYSATAQKLPTAPVDSSAHGEHRHHHEGDEDGSAGSAYVGADHSICPFAMAAVGAPAPDQFGTRGVAEVVIGHLAAQAFVFLSSFGPSRAQQSRAPPFFS